MPAPGQHQHRQCLRLFGREVEVRHDRAFDGRPRILEVRDVPGERGSLPREPAEVVLLGRLVADLREIGADRAAVAVDHVARATSLLAHEALGEVDRARAFRLAVVAVALIAVHLHERVLVGGERVTLAERAAEERLLPVRDLAVRGPVSTAHPCPP